MAWKLFTQAQIDVVARQLFMPLILLVNYTLLIYLLTFYWTRRSITIIGRDLNKKIKFRAIQILTYVAEFLIIANIAVVLLAVVVVVKHDALPGDLRDTIFDVCEGITVAFIFCFRYYYVIISRGVKDLWTNRKLEICWYLLFATHEMPFALLEEASGLPWEFPRSLWNRITLAGCLWMTARTKLRESSHDSKVTKSPSVAHTLSRSPTQFKSVWGASSKSFRRAKSYVVATEAVSQ